MIMYPFTGRSKRGDDITVHMSTKENVELYREGKWPETPEGVGDKSFRDKVRLWVRAEDSRSPEALKHKKISTGTGHQKNRCELVSPSNVRKILCVSGNRGRYSR